MPTGTTSKRSGSRLRRMLPADTHEMACSLLRPPNTTATRMRAWRNSHNLRGYRPRCGPGPERRTTRPEARSISVMRSSVSSMPAEIRANPALDLIAPTSPAVNRGVDAAKACRGHQQLAAAAPGHGRLGRRRIPPTTARRIDASGRWQSRSPDRRTSPDSAPSGRPDVGSSMVANAWALTHCRSKRSPAVPRLRSSSQASKVPRIGPASRRSRSTACHQFQMAARHIAGQQVAVPGQRLRRTGHHQVRTQ